MSKILTIIALILSVQFTTSCNTDILSISTPTPTPTPLPTPTPTPAPDPCSIDAMRKLASEIKTLANRYIETTENGESWLPLLPELLDLQTDVKHILNIPICMERMKNTLNMYTDIDIDELQDLMTTLAEGNLNNAIQTARSWFEDTVIKSSE
jgi:hypothetical protein